MDAGERQLTRKPAPWGRAARSGRDADPLAHLRRPVLLTHAGLVAERLWRAFWPVLTVLLAVAAPVYAGLDAYFAPGMRAPWLLGGAAIMLVLFLDGLRRLRWPRREEALARVDAQLAGRPLAALADSQATGAGDAATGALWQAHLQRMARASRAARPVPPDLDVAARDPFGLRLVALLVFLTAVIFASPGAAPGADSRNARPGQTLADGPAWEGWIEPPAYMGRPTLYLADLPEGEIQLPQNARITIRLYGDGGLRIEAGVSESGAEPDEVFTVTRDGRIAILGEGGAEWQVVMQRDQPPVVSISGPPDIEASGRMSQPFAAEDDNAVTSGSATFVLDPARVERRFGLVPDPDPRPPLIVDLPMPFSGDRSAIEETLIEDFSRHPFANMPVTMALTVRDAIDQTGESAPVEMVLPGRRFFEPVARAVIEQRRDLLWSRDNAPRVLDLLRAIAHRPESLFPSPEPWESLRAAIALLADAVAEDRLAEAEDEIADALWEVALELEEGALANALARLERAQERLSQAMRDGATPEEIAELMRELREATDDWLDLLAQNAEPAPDQTDQPQSGPDDRESVTEDEIQALMDRIQELMEEGRMEEAEALMRQLDQLLRNLQMQEESGAGGGRSGPGREQMQDMQETLRGQQDLSDDAFRELQDRFNGRTPEAGTDEGNQEGAGGEPGDEESLAARQQALQAELDRQRAELPGLTGEAAERARESLDRAGEAMERAAVALGADDLAGAINHQADALSALREGLEQLGRALAENDRLDEADDSYARSEDGSGRPAPERRDPLGRQAGENGRHGADQALRDGLDPGQRAQELLDELRRRAGERGREALERDYLERLLELF